MPPYLLNISGNFYTLCHTNATETPPFSRHTLLKPFFSSRLRFRSVSLMMMHSINKDIDHPVRAPSQKARQSPYAQGHQKKSKNPLYRYFGRTDRRLRGMLYLDTADLYFIQNAY